MMRKWFVSIMALLVLLSACTTNKKVNQSGSPDGLNANGETAFIEAIRDRDVQKVLKLLDSDRVDIEKPDADGIPPALVAIKVGIDVRTLDAILQKTNSPPVDIMDGRTKNAYDYVKDYRNNNASYLRVLDKYQELKG